MSQEPKTGEETPNETTPVFESAPTPASETGDIGTMDTPVAEPEEIKESEEENGDK